MTKTYCDICGQEIKDEINTYPVIQLGYRRYEYSSNGMVFVSDICKSCRHKLLDIVEHGWDK